MVDLPESYYIRHGREDDTLEMPGLTPDAPTLEMAAVQLPASKWSQFKAGFRNFIHNPWVVTPAKLAGYAILLVTLPLWFIPVFFGGLLYGMTKEDWVMPYPYDRTDAHKRQRIQIEDSIHQRR